MSLRTSEGGRRDSNLQPDRYGRWDSIPFVAFRSRRLRRGTGAVLRHWPNRPFRDGPFWHFGRGLEPDL